MSISLTLLRASSDEYKEYKQLLSKIKYFERCLRAGYTPERVSYEYYINKDRLKELKKILRKERLIK